MRIWETWNHSTISWRIQIQIQYTLCKEEEEQIPSTTQDTKKQSINSGNMETRNWIFTNLKLERHERRLCKCGIWTFLNRILTPEIWDCEWKREWCSSPLMNHWRDEFDTGKRHGGIGNCPPHDHTRLCGLHFFGGFSSNPLFVRFNLSDFFFITYDIFFKNNL